MLFLHVVLGFLCGCLIVLVGSLIGILVFIVMGCGDPEDFFGNKILKLIAIFILLASCIVGPISNYYTTMIDLEKLSSDYEYNLNNILTLARQINEKVVIKTAGDRIIIDVANLSQSTITSNVYISYVDSANKYNNQFAEYKVKCSKGFFRTLAYGFYAELPSNLKYIQIKL